VETPLLMGEELIREVRNELAEILTIDQADLHFLKSYYIPQALPNIENPTMHLKREQIARGNGIYLAGDYLLGGSLNGAMLSGRQCAEVLLADFKNT
jgi:hypothetical protein